MNAKDARFVGSGRNYAPVLGPAAHQYGLPDQIRVV
jgi:hypothetical protein